MSRAAGIRDRAQDVGERVFGFASLKSAQLEAIEALVDNTDVLAVMPTGYGKSAIYQVAAHLIAGPTVVVSPLIALQRDQVSHIAAASGEESAVAVNSQLSSSAEQNAWDAVASGEAEFVFLAPEQLARDEVMEQLRQLKVALFVVDEAHCVSSWGHDFRPDYLRLGEVIEALGHPTVLALTATGSSPVRQEIIERLELAKPRVLVGGFDRPNVHLAVVRHESEQEKNDAVLEQVTDAEHPGLLYVATRADTERFAAELGERGLRSAFYHGGMGAKARREAHERFLADEFDVVVATSAFGMGIDKPDLRFIVHADVTESIDAYYQEVGRGGRDGAPAAATLHYRQEDLGLRRFFAGGAPKKERVAAVYSAIQRGNGTVKQLAEDAGLSIRSVQNTVNQLSEAGIVSVGDDGVPRVVGAASRAEAIAAVNEVVQRRVRVDESRLAMIRGYAETQRCRRQFLLEYFGDELAQPCGNCDNCDAGIAYEHDADAAANDEAGEPFAVDQRVRHADWGIGRVMSLEPDRITVFFEQEGYRVLSREIIAGQNLLQPL